MSRSPFPTVCVVMPAYKSAESLPAAAASVLRQTHRDLVLGIGVRATDLETLEAAHGIEDSRVKLVIVDGASIANARNCIIRGVSAESYMFLDSDDEYARDDIVEAYLRDRDRVPGLRLRYGDWIAVSTIDGSLRPRAMPEPGRRPYRQLLMENFVATGTVMVPAEMLDTVGLFDDRYPHAEDWDLWLRIAQHYPLRHVRIPVLLYARQKMGRVFPRSHFSSEWTITSRQPIGAATRTIASLAAHGRYAAYFIATLRQRRGREFLDLRLLDLIGLPAAAVVRLIRYGRLIP